MIDMSKWQEIAKERIHTRIAAPGRLNGKIVIVTGAAQGFGKGIAEEMYKEGAAVVIADLNAALAQEVAQALGERAVSVAVNVADEESVAQMVQQTVEHFGGIGLTQSFALELCP